MTRLSIFAIVLISSAAAVLTATGGAPPSGCPEVPPLEAANIRGGQCGSYGLTSNGACTASGSDSCTSGRSNCSGLCSYTCATSSTYGGSGSFTGSLITSECDSTTQPTCTETVCSIAGAPVACCQCLNPSDISCGPAPTDLTTVAISSSRNRIGGKLRASPVRSRPSSRAASYFVWVICMPA